MTDYQAWKRFLELADAMTYRPNWLTVTEFGLVCQVASNPTISLLARQHHHLTNARTKIMAADARGEL